MNHYSLIEVTPAANEPLSVADAKAWMRVETDADDVLITGLVRAARQYVEKITGRKLVSSVWQQAMDRFPLLPNSQFAPGNPNVLQPVLNNLWPINPAAWAIFLMQNPVISVDSVTYFDGSGNLQTMPSSDWILDNASRQARLTPATGSYWPVCQFRTGAVTIQFTCGYAAAVGAMPAMPETDLMSIKLLTAQWYQNREAVVVAPSMKPVKLPWALESLLDVDRLYSFG